MTLFERDALAILLSLNTTFIVLLSPLVPMAFSFNESSLYLWTLIIGLLVGGIGVWMNHYAARRTKNDPPRRS